MDEKVVAVERHQTKASFLTTCLTICSCIAGAGIITLPHGLAKAGWIGVLIICLAGAMSIFTGSIGVKSLYLSKYTHASFVHSPRTN